MASKQSSTVKSYDIYSQLKSWGTNYKGRERYQSTRSNELMKKYMSNGYKSDYRPRRNPYVMQKQRNYIYVERNPYQQKRKDYNEDRRRYIFKKQKISPSKQQTAVKSEKREVMSAIHNEDKHKDVQKQYVTNQSISHNQTKPIKQINDDKLDERQRKKVDTTIHQTSNTYLQQSEKRNNNLSDKVRNEKEDTFKSTSIIVQGKHEAERKQTVIKETKTTKNSKYIDDDFHNKKISVNQYDETVKKNKDSVEAKTHEKVKEVDRKVNKDIHIDHSDISREEENYFTAVKKDLGTKDPKNKLKNEVQKAEVKREEVKNQLSDREDSIEKQIDDIEDETLTEMEKKKKSVKERDYFQPIPAPVIPPVRQAKKTTQKPKSDPKQDTKLNKADQTVKPSKNNSRDVKQYGRNKPVEKEPPKTVKYPSREEIALRNANGSPSPNNSPPPSPPATPPISKMADITDKKPERITPEEEKIMKTLLGTSDKCYVKSSRPKVTSA